MHRMIPILMLGTAMTVAGWGLPASAETTFTQVIDGLKRTESLVGSATGTTVVVASNSAAAIPASSCPRPANTTRTYKWAFQAREWRHELSDTTDSVTLPPKYLGFRNEKYVIYDPASQAMQVYGVACRGKVGVIPFWAQYLGLGFLLDDMFPRLSSKIESANAAVTGTESDGGKTLVTLQGVSTQGQTVRWWLHPDYGYLPSRVEERWADPGGGYRDILVVTTYGDYAEVAGGVWLPKTCSVVKTVTRADGSLSEDTKVDATSVLSGVNTAIASDALDIVPAVGTTVVYTESIKTAQ